MYIQGIFASTLASLRRLDRGVESWKEAGESEEAYDEAQRAISEAEAKISSASETTKAH
jgi:hypothetical protein